MSESRLKQFREHKDHYYATGDNSPLTDEQKASFTGLKYFDEAPELSFSLRVDASAPGAGEDIDIPTTDKIVKQFRRIGRVSFEVAGEPKSLSVFRDLARGRLFIPFTDGTNGVETYKDGRYLDPQERPDGSLTIDFNFAYNPYCAFSDGWSCPIPPEENRISARIEAGERI
jgi:uncharacterized protein (DUF1684 family)